MDRHPQPMISNPSEVTRQTPKVETQQQPQDTPNHKQNPDSQRAAPASASADKHTTSSGDQGEEKGTEFFPVIFGVRLKITDTLLASFTLVLAISTIFLWKTTDRGFTELERPWVHYAPISNNFETAWQNVRHVTEPTIIRFEMRFIFMNHGRSPAILTNLRLSIDVKPFTPPGDSAPVTQLRGNPVIRSGGSGFEYQVWVDAHVNSSNANYILSGVQRLWCWGTLIYQDAGSSSDSKRKFITEFLWRFDGETNAFSPFNDEGTERNRRT
jgi:hypothetical protein